VFLVGMLSLVAVYEVAVGAAEDALGWSRAKSVVVFGVLQLVASIPAVLSVRYIVWSDLIWGTTMMPVGSALAVVTVAWSVGRARLLEELGRHSRMPVTPLLVYWMKFVVPLGIAVILVYGWWDALGG
jgi:SNF family Na+-dependent transporter